MFNVDLIVLSYHRFGTEESPYRFSRTYEQFSHDIVKKVYDWVSIDDGMRCQVQACEIMRHCNIRAKLFIPTSLIGEPGYCTWDEIRELSKYHDIENHSHSHKWHTQMLTGEIIDSIERTNYLIESHIGRRPRYFVPPYNAYDDRVMEACQQLNLTLVKNRITILNNSK